MDILKPFMHLFNGVNKFREKLENDLADVLQKIDKNTKLDELEVLLLKKGYQALGSYYGATAFIPDSAYQTLAEETNKAKGNANRLLQKQLRK